MNLTERETMLTLFASWRGLHDKTKSTVLMMAMLIALQSCVSTNVEPHDLKAGIDALYPHQSEEIRSFFAQEAHRAGVRTIREMRVGEKPKKIHSKQSGCGVALFDRKALLINPRKEQCLRLAHLAHEITHIAVLRLHCYGHGNKFYDYNLAIANRFEQQFPDAADRGGWNSPVQNVENRSKNYRSDAERCV
ncbi:MAG: hypothetical protein ACR2QW_14545 [bacterium]